MLGLVFLGTVHPRVRLLVEPGPQWLAVHLRWTAVLVCAAALLARAMRDQAADRAAWLRNFRRDVTSNVPTLRRW